MICDIIYGMPVATWEEDIRDVLFKETPEIFCIADDFCRLMFDNG